MSHGTPRAASAHRRRGQRLCPDCRRGENRRKLVYVRARRAAVEALIRLHPGDFQKLYAEEREIRMAEQATLPPVSTQERGRLRAAAYAAALRRLADEEDERFRRYYREEKNARGI